jgi:hypothetical protein
MGGFLDRMSQGVAVVLFAMKLSFERSFNGCFFETFFFAGGGRAAGGGLLGKMIFFKPFLKGIRLERLIVILLRDKQRNNVSVKKLVEKLTNVQC